MKKKFSLWFIQVGYLFVILFPLRSPIGVDSQEISADLAGSPPRPDPINVARWLVANNTWGILSTISIDLGGAPYSNVASYSDGEPGHGFGIPYFYLSNLESHGGNTSINGSLAAFTVTKNTLGLCNQDPQNPTCTRTTLTGWLKMISLEDPEVKLAQVALFTKHPELKEFPASENFQIYKLVLESIFVVQDFGIPTRLTPKDYLSDPPKGN